MARQTQTTEINLSLSASQARSALKALENQAKSLKAAMEAAVKAGDKAKAKSLQQELNRTNNLIRNMHTEAANAADVLRRLDTSTPKELRKTLSTLTRQLQGMKRGSEEFAAQAAKIRQVRAALDDVNRELRQQPGLWERIKSAGTGAVAAVQSVIGQISGAAAFGREAVEQYAAMQAEMANVSKYSGMSAQEVERLNDALKTLDTRTTREDLNRLAQDAGRLGKTSVDDILGFVKAADQINVALEDLGDGATLTLSKLAGMFGVEKEFGTESALLKTGSVINELSQNCSASAPYIAEFTSRMGATGVQAKMTIPQIMAYGAVLDTVGMNVEASSTALSQLITRMFTDPAKYAKAAGLDVKQFTELLNKDANAALLTLLETLGKAGGMDKIAPMFADMGEKGANSVKALGALAAQIDAVKAQQIAANEAFEEGTSISREFDVQNNTVAASLDKQKNLMHETIVAIGEQLLPVMDVALKSGNAMMKVVSWLISFLKNNTGVLLTIAAAWSTYAIAANLATLKLKLHVAAEILHTTWLKVKQAALLLAAAAQATLTGNTVRATAALRAFQATIGPAVSGLGLLAAGITAAIGLLISYTAGQNAAAKAQRELNKIKDEAKEKAKQETSSILTLVAAAENERISLDERRKAILRLNEIIPNYNAQLDATTGKYTANKVALDDYIRSLERMYEIEGAKDKLAEIGKQRLKLREEREQLRRDMDRYRASQNYSSASYSGSNISTTGTAPGTLSLSVLYSQSVAASKAANSRLDAKEAQLDEQVKLLTDLYGDDIQRSEIANISGNNAEADGGGEDSAGGGYTPHKTKAELKEEEKQRKAAERARKAAERKAKQEFKDGLEAIDSFRNMEDVQANQLYRAGFIDWREFQKRLHQNEQAMLDDKMKYYEKADLKDDEDYTALAKRKEERLRAFEERDRKYALSDISNERTREENQAQLDYATPGNEIFRNEEQLQQRLHAIRMKYLGKERDLYVNTSEEWRSKQEEIEQAESEEKLRKQKIMASLITDYAKEYNKRAAESRMADELAVLETLKDKKILNEKEYEEAKNALKAKYSGTANKETKNISSEYGSMLVNLWNGIHSFFETSSASTLDKISATAQAAYAIMSAALSSYSQYAAAQAEYETAVISKAYDRRIALAKNNSAKQRRLEEAKDRSIAKAKAEQAEENFAMQLATAIAQTAVNAILAYQAGLQAGGPAGLALAPIAAAMAVAAGAVQIATIQKQKEAAQISGYVDGGFTPSGPRDKEVGVVHAGEWVASQKLVNNPATRPMINLLEQAQRSNVFPSIGASDVSRTITASERSAASSANTANTIAATSAAMTSMATSAGTTKVITDSSHTNESLRKAVAQLTEVLSEPITANVSITGRNGIERAQRRYSRLVRNSK